MDPIANMLIAVKNAGLVKKASVVVPHSKIKLAILSVLKDEGYVKAYEVVGDEKKPSIEIAIAYKDKLPRISGVSRVSKPSKRVYLGTKEITPTKYGHGITVLSTPKGVLTDKVARKELVGGEALFTIW
jgi:small subunit ribosomal protein S8